jgi:hypothetical protein
MEKAKILSMVTDDNTSSFGHGEEEDSIMPVRPSWPSPRQPSLGVWRRCAVTPLVFAAAALVMRKKEDET